MPHTFRTIEQFVQLCDQRSDFHAQNGPDVSNAELRGYVKAYKEIAEILRTSNLGIVYPPAGAPVRDTSSLCNGARHEASKFLQENSECRDAIELFLARRAFRAGWDARDQMKTESGK